MEPQISTLGLRSNTKMFISNHWKVPLVLPPPPTCGLGEVTTEVTGMVGHSHTHLHHIKTTCSINSTAKAHCLLLNQQGVQSHV